MLPPSAPPVLQSVLERYPQLSPWSLAVEGQPSQGYSGAGVCRIDSPLGAVAVRRWPDGWPRERLRGLHRLLAHIHRAGVEFVAVPHRSKDGDTIVDMAGSLWQIEPWRPGVADYHRKPSRERLIAAMHALAAWHRAAATFLPQSAEAAWFAPLSTGPCPAVLERRQAFAHLSPEGVREWSNLARQRVADPAQPYIDRFENSLVRHAPVVASELSLSATWDVPRQVCLRDVWHDHLLFTGTTVTGLIDPSAARTDSVASDLARLIGSLIEGQVDDWRTAIDAYRRSRILTLAEERLIPVLDRSGILLSAATWLRWLGLERRFTADSVVVLDRLQRLAGRCTALR